MNNVIRLRSLLIPALSCALASALSADISGVLVTGDLARQQGVLTEISKTDLRLNVSGQAVVVPWSQVLLFEGASLAPASEANSKPAFVVLLRDGQRIAGKPGAVEGDAIEWSTTYGTRRQLMLKDVSQIIAGSQPIHTNASDATQDILQLANGDVVSGVIESGDDTTITCLNADGQSISIEWAHVRSIRLAPAGEPSRAVGAMRLTLVDGSRLLCESITLRDKTMSFVVDQATASVPSRLVQSIEHLAGDTMLLSTLTPTQSSYQPYFPRTSSGVSEEAEKRVTIAGLTTRSAILMRPRSVQTWSLEGLEAKTFRTRYGIPSGLPVANATVRIKLDDKTVHEQADVRTNHLSELVAIELNGARSLTLEVDFGEAFDVQDQVYWIEPALAR